MFIFDKCSTKAQQSAKTLIESYGYPVYSTRGQMLLQEHLENKLVASYTGLTSANNLSSFAAGQSWLAWDGLDSTLTQNGDFATGDGTNWSESGSTTATEDYTGNELTVTMTGDGSKVYRNTLSSALEKGKLYKLSITIRDYSTSASHIYAGEHTSTNDYLIDLEASSDGVHTAYFVATANSTEIWVGNTAKYTDSFATGDVFTIDDITVKEVLTDFSDYASDEYEVVLTDSGGLRKKGVLSDTVGGGEVLDTTLVTNGTFDSDITGWESHADTYAWDTFEWDTDHLHLVHDAVGVTYTIGGSDQNIPVVTGKLYKWTFDYDITSGTMNSVLLRSRYSGGDIYLTISDLTGSGTITRYWIATVTANIAVSLQSGDAVECSLDNFSLQEVTDTTGVYVTWGTTETGFNPNAIEEIEIRKSPFNVVTGF